MANDLKIRVVWDMLDKITKPLKAIQSSGGATAKALKQTRDQLRDLNAQQKAVGDFRDLQRGLKESQQRLRETQERVRELAQGMRAVENPSRAMTREFDRAVAKARAVKDQVQQQGRQLQTLRDRLSAAGISTQNLGTHERTLRTDIAAANTQLQQQQQRLAAVTRQQERLQKARAAYGRGVQTAAAMAGTGMAARGTGMYTGQKLGTLLGVGYEFDATMSNTQAVTRIKDKNDPAMQALRQQARTLPLSSKFTDSQVAQGQYFLGRTGYNPQQILGAMPGMLNLAAAGDLDLGETADIASNIQVAAGIPAERMDKVADILTAAFTRNNVDIRMLGDSLKYSAGVGKAFGQSLETTTTATALLGNAGIQGSMAGTTMRSVYTRIGNSAAVKKLGVKTEDEKGNLLDLYDILQQIDDKTKHMGDNQRGAVFKSIAGQYAISGFTALMESVNSGKFGQMRTSLQNSEGEAAQVAATQLDNLKGDMTMLHAGLENISVELFEKNSPWLRELADDLKHLLHNIADFLKEHPNVSKGIVMMLGGFSVLMAVLGSLTIAMAGILGPMVAIRFALTYLGIKLPGAATLLRVLGSAIRWVAGAFVWLSRLAMANPIVAALTAIAIGAYLIYRYWEPIKAFFGGLWDEIKAAFAGGIGGVAALLLNWSPLGLLYRALAGTLAWFGIDLPKKFSEFGGNILRGLVSGITGALGWVKSAISGVADSTIGWFKDKLGIRSPSRVFAQLGGFTMQGLEQGIENGQQGPVSAISGLSLRLTQIGAGIAIGAATAPAIAFDTRPPLNAGAGRIVQVDSHDRYEIVIQPAAGMDARAIAAAVAAELDRREREKASRLRTMYTDYDN